MTIQEAINRLKEGEPFSEIYDPVWNEALDMAIQELEKGIPKQPRGHYDTWGCYVVNCPTCGHILYCSDWYESDMKECFTERCTCCGQQFTPKGRYIGQYEDEQTGNENNDASTNAVRQKSKSDTDPEKRRAELKAELEQLGFMSRNLTLKSEDNE